MSATPIPFVTRRRFLATAAVGAAAIALPGSARRALGQYQPANSLFTLGVASGDPLPWSVVLWTRLAPDPLAGGGMPARPVSVHWEVANDPGMRRVVRRGTERAWAQFGHSVHPEVWGLEPDREYWYRFRVGDQQSAVGRTRTSPAPWARPDEFRFAFASCQDWQNGYWPAYRALAGEDIDLVVHLGDYIYEYGPEAKTRVGSPADRVANSAEVTDLISYRNRYAQYRTDPALQAAHAVAPWILTWDDHEIENNYASAIREENATPPGDFAARRVAAAQAYYEHMPLRRRSSPNGAQIQLYRRLAWGRLARFHVLDTRQYRTDQPLGDGLKSGSQRFDPAATMTGATQEAWLFDGLDRSPARWNVLAQQTIFAQVDFNPAPGSQGTAGLFNVDQWDGYAAQRGRISQFLADRKPSNPIVITGDIHSSWVNDLKLDYADPRSATIGTEFVGTSISSDFPEAFIAPVTAALSDNPHIRFFDGRRRGYVRCVISPHRWQSDYRTVETVDVVDAPTSTLASFVVENGVPGAQRA